MKIGESSSIKTIRLTGGTGTAALPTVGRGDLQLTPGQLVLGKVAGFSDQGLLLDIAGRLVAAESHVALQVGQEVWLEVKEGGERPWFIVADKKVATREMLRALLADTAVLGKAASTLTDAPRAGLAPGLAARLEALLADFAAVVVGGEPEPEAVIRLVAWLGGGRPVDSGPPRALYLERLGVRLAEILAAGGEAEPEVAGEAASARVSLKKMADFLEMVQQLNGRPLSSDQQLFYLFPCFFSGASGWGEWLIGLDREAGKKGAAGGMVDLEFFLEMSRLGSVHLRFVLEGQAVQGEITLVDEPLVDYLRGQLPDLSRAIEGFGYGPVRIHCRQSSRNLLQGLKEALEDKARLRPDALFHVTV